MPAPAVGVWPDPRIDFKEDVPTSMAGLHLINANRSRWTEFLHVLTNLPQRLIILSPDPVPTAFAETGELGYFFFSDFSRIGMLPRSAARLRNQIPRFIRAGENTAIEGVHILLLKDSLSEVVLFLDDVRARLERVGSQGFLHVIPETVTDLEYAEISSSSFVEVFLDGSCSVSSNSLNERARTG